MSSDIHERRRQRTEAEWDALPPLIKKGENREEVLERLVVAWSTPAEDSLGWYRFYAGVLNPEIYAVRDIDFVDANTDPPDPIDIGPIIKDAGERWRSAEHPVGTFLPIIALEGCRIRQCDASHMQIDADLYTQGSRWERVSFRHALFKGRANFKGGFFADGVGFESTTFAEEAWFDFAAFEYHALFEETAFLKGAEFRSVRFLRDARFCSASFAGHAAFDFATFESEAVLGMCRVERSFSLFGCRFGSYTLFFDPFHGVFPSDRDFAGAVVASKHIAPMPRLLAWRAPRRRTVRWAALVSRSFWRDVIRSAISRLRRRVSLIGWHHTRTFSDLRLLTNASYVSLVAIPILAGLWPAVRAGMAMAKASAAGLSTELPRVIDLLNQASSVTPDDPTRAEAARLAAELIPNLSAFNAAMEQATGAFPMAWFLAFLAAACVVAGHWIYQLAAPQLAFGTSRADHIKARNDAFRAAPEHERADMVGRAMEKRLEAAKLQPWTRHPNLIRRDGRAVWVPCNELEYKEYIALVEGRAQANKGEQAPTSTPEAEKPVSDGASGASTADATSSTPPPPPAAPPAKLRPLPHTRAELDRLLVDEGGDAEYAIESRRRLVPAWIALGFYVAAMLVLLYLVLSQGRQIWREAHAKVVVPMSEPAATPPAAHADEERSESSGRAVWGPPLPD